MGRIALVLAAMLPMLGAGTLRAQVFIQEFEPVERGDTLLVGLFRDEVREQYNALMEEWNALHEKQAQTEALQRNREDMAKYSPSAANAEVARLEQQRAAALAEVDRMAGMMPADRLAEIRKGINDSYDSMIGEMPRMYAETTNQMEEQGALLAEHDAAEFSPDRKYALKRRFAALAVDGRLHGYRRIRNFRHGRAAVARGSSPTDLLWGFVDEEGHEVVPCRYFKVYDFYNVANTAGVFTERGDADSEGWTTVWCGNGVMGMIDRNGNVKIPFKFAIREIHPRIIFHRTPWGEFAQVCDAESGGYGIIDRQGNYTMPPTESEYFVWYTDIECFGYRAEEGTLVVFDPWGKAVDIEQIVKNR